MQKQRLNQSLNLSQSLRQQQGLSQSLNLSQSLRQQQRQSQSLNLSQSRRQQQRLSQSLSLSQSLRQQRRLNLNLSQSQSQSLSHGSRMVRRSLSIGTAHNCREPLLISAIAVVTYIRSRTTDLVSASPCSVR
jgi:outer membrane usher protein FimD/PapC